jgi:5'-nucleotidase
MNESPTVLVDMDGVLADFDAAILKRVAADLPHITPLPTRRNFYIADDYPEHSILIREMSRQPGFFASLPVVHGALEGWRRIIDLGYRPRVCTAPMRSNPACRTEKLAWLTKHFEPDFGPSVARQAIVTKEKHLCAGTALIDDRPEVRRSGEAIWQHIVFDRPYNQGGHRLRLHGWEDELLEELLKTAEAMRRRRTAG